ncbi:MAG: c-type cytochrome domain-containing protein, partial [Verrucomicrobiaceae bacterium]
MNLRAFLPTFSTILLAGVAFTSPVIAAGVQQGPAGNDFFEKGVRPILEKNCVSCHGPEKKKGKLTLHDIGHDFTDSSSVQLWGRVLEQLEIREMPPDDKPQPSASDRAQMIAWIKNGLTSAGRGFELSSKLLLPEYGNRVSHEMLFNGQITDLPYSPSRLWRISPEIYKGKKLQPNVRGGLEAVPLGYATKNAGIRDYAPLEIVGEADFLSLKTTFDDIITGQLHDRKVAPSKGKAGKDEIEVNGKATFKAIT